MDTITDEIQLNDTFFLVKDWKFHYIDEPQEVNWKIGSVFTVVGFSTLVDDRVVLDLEDSNGRCVLVERCIANIMFNKGQISLFEE